MRRGLIAGIAVALGLCLGIPCNALPPPPKAFVHAVGTRFELGGKPFRVAGANHHFAQYAPEIEVDDALYAAAAMGLNVIRVWAFLDIGSLDGSVPTTMTMTSPGAYQGEGAGPKGVYFQYWDPALGKPAYNDGPTGLQHLDYLLSKASRYGIKIDLVLTDNWDYYGGVPQMLRWYGIDNEGLDHGKFFTDPRLREAYRNWIGHLATRINHYTGIAYKDDPTIFSWELMNEANGAYSKTIATWASEMSASLKAIDPHHMVSLGDYGWATTNVYLDIPTLDWASFHMYPEYHDNVDEDWAVKVWIPEHLRMAAAAGKPALLAEFGWSKEKSCYAAWTMKIEELGGAGWMFWQLVGRQADGTYPLDGEGFDIVYPGPDADRLSAAALRITGRSAVATAGLPARPVAVAATTFPGKDVELLPNPGFEDGVAPWRALDGGVLDVIAGGAHSGDKACKVTGRTISWNGPFQDVRSVLSAGGSGTYTIGAWVKLASGRDMVRATVQVIDKAGEHYYTHDVQGGESWTLASVTADVTINGAISRAIFYVETDSSLVTMWVDDCSLMKR